MAENIAKCYKRGADKIKNTKDTMLQSKCGCSSDLAAVSCLPDDWVPKHGGATLAKFLEEREQKHNKLFEDFTSQTCAFNSNIDDKVRELAEKMVAQIQQTKTDMNCAVANVSQSKNLTYLLTSNKTRRKVLKKITELYEQCIKDIDQYKESALEIETERAEGLKNILRDQFQRFVAVGHHPPKTLLHEFDDHMYEINQQLLSNIRAYDELEAELKSEVDDNMTKVKSALNQACHGAMTASQIRTPYYSSDIRRPISRPISASDRKRAVSEPYLNKYIDIQEEIDDCVSKLVEGYRQAVLKAFTGVSGQLTDLHNTLRQYTGQTQAFCHSPFCTKLEATINGALKRISVSFHKKLSEIKSDDLFQMAESDVFDIEKSLSSLGECLRDTYTILHDAGHLWDAHMMRSALAQKLTITAVEDLLTNNDIIEQASEVNLNLALEQMRVAPDEAKLKILYESVQGLLKNTTDMYQQHSAAELERLEQFMNLPPAMADVLLAEFHCFLQIHPRVLLQSNRRPSELNSPNTNDSVVASSARDMYLRSELPRALLLTQLQETALMNWRNGFLEAFEYNVGFVPEDLKHQARQWVEERAGILRTRYSLKQVSYSIRAERVKSIYDNRLAQLRQHQARLESHINAVHYIIQSLPKDVAKFLSLDSPEIFPIQDKITEIDKRMLTMLANTKLDFDSRKTIMMTYITQLNKYRQQFEESLQAAIKEYNILAEHRIQNARISNVRFSAHVKLFSENGNYSVAEAQTTTAELTRAAALLESCKSRTDEALSHGRNRIISQVDSMMQPLRRKIDGYMKDTKIVTDKKSNEKRKKSK